MHQAFPHHWGLEASHFASSVSTNELVCFRARTQNPSCSPRSPERLRLWSRSLALLGYVYRPTLAGHWDRFKGHGLFQVKRVSLLTAPFMSRIKATLQRAPHIHIFNPCLPCQGLCVTPPCKPAGPCSTNQLRPVFIGTECPRGLICEAIS